MSTTLEKIPEIPLGDDERLVESEQLRAVREQLDSRLSVPDLTNQQRNEIIADAKLVVGEFMKGGLLDWGSSVAAEELQRVVARLAEITDVDSGRDDKYTPAHLQAAKYYAGTLFEIVRSELAKEDDSEEAEKMVGMLAENYFSTSPNITSYAGGLSGQLELLAYANRSPYTQELLPNVSGEIIYSLAGGPSSMVVADAIAAKEKSPVAQLEIIDTITKLAHEAPLQGEWAESVAEEVGIGLQMVAGGHGGATPFVRLAAYSKSAEAFLVEDDGGQLVLDARALTGLETDGLTEDQAMLLKTIHNPNMRALIEQELSIDLSQLSRQAQLRLVTFLTEANSDRYEHLVRVMKETETKAQGLAETFLALEFGDDYGDVILSIAEHASLEQAKAIFETVNAFREHSAKMAGWYKDFDPEFAEGAERALNERLTDALYAVEELVRTGRLEADVAPHRSTPDYVNDGRFILHVQSVEEGLEILKGLEQTLDLETKILTAPDVVITKAAKNIINEFAIYRATSKAYGQMLIYTREYGAESFDPNFEYGNSKGVEASVSFMVNPRDPHAHLSVSKDPNAVSIRFDREGRKASESPSSQNRSPIAEEGTISSDISSVLGKSKSLPVRIGRFLAAGNLLRAAKVGSEESLNHNTNGFDQEKYGAAEGFAALSRYVRRQLEAMIRYQKLEKQGSAAALPQNTPEDYLTAA